MPLAIGWAVDKVGVDERLGVVEPVVNGIVLLLVQLHVYRL